MQLPPHCLAAPGQEGQYAGGGSINNTTDVPDAASVRLAALQTEASSQVQGGNQEEGRVWVYSSNSGGNSGGGGEVGANGIGDDSLSPLPVGFTPSQRYSNQMSPVALGRSASVNRVLAVLAFLGKNSHVFCERVLFLCVLLCLQVICFASAFQFHETGPQVWHPQVEHVGKWAP